MNFDRFTFILVRIGAMLRRVLPRPYSWVSVLRTGFARKSYFRTTGMLRSYAAGRPMDGDGNALPLMTTGMADLLVDRLTPTMHVFEYGSGSSTHFFSQRVATVTSVEHDSKWIDAVRADIAPNVELLQRDVDDNGEYCRAIREHDRTYDVVAVDGRDRINCLREALTRVGDTGVIIFDDSERTRYAPALDIAAEAGFRRLDFSGLRPTGVRESTTTLLYRPGNCFEL